MASLEKTIQDLIKPDESSLEGHLTVDVYQNTDEIIIQSAVAGVKGEDLDLDIAKDSVTIKGFRQKPDGLPISQSLHQELHWGKFSRSVILPADVDMDQAKASIKNGLLTIRLPKLKNI